MPMVNFHPIYFQILANYPSGMVHCIVADPVLVKLCQAVAKRRSVSAIVSAIYSGMYKENIQARVIRDLGHLCSELCMDNFQSILKKTSPDCLIEFDWEAILSEWKNRGVLLHEVLQAIIGKKEGSAQKRAIPVIGLAGSALLYGRSQKMYLV